MSFIHLIIPVLVLHSRLACAALRIDFGKRAHTPRMSPRDAGTVEVTAEKNLYYVMGGSYFANITVGTPPQTIEVQLDTGSPDLGVNTPQGCTSTTCVGGLCEYKSVKTAGPMLTVLPVDPTRSSSYKLTYPDLFVISYVNNENLIGDFATDNVSVGGANLKNMTLGVSNNSTLPFNIMGLSPTPVVSNASIDAIQDYLFTPLHSLVSSGAIQSRIFSVWLNDLSSATGSILFGGVDESRFDQTVGLTQLDMLKDEQSNSYERYQVPMTQMSLHMAGQSKSLTLPSSNTPGEAAWLPVTIDTGSPVLQLPQDLFNAINAQVGAITNSKFPGQYGLPCATARSLAFASSYISWTLGDPKNESISITYNLALSDLVIPIYINGAPVAEPVNGTHVELCAFGIQPKTSDEGTNLMGDPFIRAMYVVFDPDNGKMAFGKPLFNATQSKAVAVANGQQIPDIVLSEPDKDAACDYGSGSLGNGTVSASRCGPSATGTAQSSSSGAVAGLIAPGTATLIFTVMLSVAVTFMSHSKFR